jgi:hypothetical protein
MMLKTWHKDGEKRPNFESCRTTIRATINSVQEAVRKSMTNERKLKKIPIVVSASVSFLAVTLWLIALLGMHNRTTLVVVITLS